MNQVMNMTLAELFGGITGVIVLLSVFIEITPIKINPVSRFLKWIGRKMNSELTDKFTALQEQVNEIESVNEKRYILGCRVRILRFGDEVRRGDKHSQESFDQVLSDIDDYERYCHKHKEFKNNKTVATTEKILKVYSEQIDTNGFL